MRKRHSSHYHERLFPRAVVFDAIKALADKRGVIENRVIARVADQLGAHISLVARDIAYFIASGELIRIVPGRYLLPGFAKPPEPKPRLELGVHPTTSGIEAVTFIRMYVGMTGAARFVRMTLPRVPCLERPLPQEGA